MIGRTVSHYRIVEELGAGGMGIVYRAEDLRLKRMVALKFLPPELTRNAEARERFSREAQAASALDHANICTIYDIEETDDGRLFIAMALYEGETLRERIDRGPLAINEAIDIAGQIAAGLDRAHERGIVHRDLKPSNIVVTDRREVRILDFGVAKLAAEAGITRTGTSIGTVAYMAPELLEGGEVDARTDLWALGVVLYEMLTGRRPFSRQGEQATAFAILNEEPESIETRREDVAPDLAALVGELLAKDPDFRPPSAAAVAKRLRALTREGEVDRLAIGMSEAQAAWTLLRRPSVAVPVLLVLALVAAALILPARQRAARDAARALLPQIETLAREGNYREAHLLAARAQERLGPDTTLDRLLRQVSDEITITSDPPGARVFLTPFAPEATGPPAAAFPAGVTPIEALRVPRADYLVRIAKEEYRPADRIASTAYRRNEIDVRESNVTLHVTLQREDEDVPADMVFVPGGPYRLVSHDAPLDADAELSDFFIDRFEVSNEKYREFILAGGYREPSYWTAALGDDGTSPSRRALLALLTDRTGLSAPRGWTGQEPPPGEGNYPVAGVTWYEAAAYCAWKGRALPTVFQWEKAARDGVYVTAYGRYMPWGYEEPSAAGIHRANFGSSGPAPVDAHPFGIGPFGAYAMAGNVKEWTATRFGDGRLATGGSWDDPLYLFAAFASYPERYAAPTLGFRCALMPGGGEAGPDQLALETRTPVYEPVDAATFRTFLSHYRYDRKTPDATILESLETADWIREKIRLEGVGGDSIIAYLYLPKRVEPPFQTLVYVPGSNTFFGTPVSEDAEWLLGPHIKAGRAVFTVVLDGMTEREWPPGASFPEPSSVRFRDLMVLHATELGHGLDYLETRPDIDSDKLAYVGLSWGAGSRVTFAAIHGGRFAAVILIGAGIDERVQPTLPEAANFNFVPYIPGPTLVVNGSADEEHRWLTRALPLWDLLPEPKELELIEGAGHVPPVEARVPPINAFLDRVLGPVSTQ